MEKHMGKQVMHRHLYNNLADEYRKRALDILVERDLSKKAKRLKSISQGEKALEIGVGGGIMNKLLKSSGFQTTGIDIAENMIVNAKELNPEGRFMTGDYAKIKTKQKYDLIVGLAFIHLFAPEEAKQLLHKMYDDLEENGVLHLTTTKEKKNSYDIYNKSDYGQNYSRYRAKHTPESFTDLIKATPFTIEGLEIEEGAYGKQRMSLRARK